MSRQSKSSLSKYDQIKQKSAELRALPKDWTFFVDHNEPQRVGFKKIATGQTTYAHPSHGALPPSWILRLLKDSKGVNVVYFNRETGKITTDNPRLTKETLKKQAKAAPEDLRISAALRRTDPGKTMDLQSMVRSEILNTNIRDKFDIIHTIDPGDGTKGGMNGGVFVVRMKKIPTSLYVEKRFKKDELEIGRAEIEMLRHLKHCSLTFFSSAFVTNGFSPEASVYVEFCDRGSLDDIIKAYAQRGDPSCRHRVPEAFIWHAFIGLCDGLAYMQTGRSFFSPDAPKSNWIPILHRDMKPDNVLLRSRTTVYSEKYPYCVLSDFGLACEDRLDIDPLANKYQKRRSQLGTKAWFAPELCWDPYPRETPAGEQFIYFPPGNRHSMYSDVWSLGASMFNLCYARHQPPPHLKARPYNDPSGEKWFGGRSYRIPLLPVPDYYTPQLRKAIQLATTCNPRDRPDATALVKQLSRLSKEAGYEDHGNMEKLPGWATRIHEYHGKAESISGRLLGGGGS